MTIRVVTLCFVFWGFAIHVALPQDRAPLPASKGVIQLRLIVYDRLGREVAVLVNERKTAGSHQIKFDASKLSSGVYVYQLRADNFAQAKTLMLLR